MCERKSGREGKFKKNSCAFFMSLRFCHPPLPSPLLPSYGAFHSPLLLLLPISTLLLILSLHFPFFHLLPSPLPPFYLSSLLPFLPLTFPLFLPPSLPPFLLLYSPSLFSPFCHLYPCKY